MMQKGYFYGSLKPNTVSTLNTNIFGDRYHFYEHGGVIGNIEIFHYKDTDVIYLSSFQINKRFRGQGYGKKYLIKILEELRKFENVTWVGLCVLKSNTVALNLYTKLGFVKLSTINYEGVIPKYEESENIFYMIRKNLANIPEYSN